MSQAVIKLSHKTREHLVKLVKLDKIVQICFYLKNNCSVC